MRILSGYDGSLLGILEILKVGAGFRLFSKLYNTEVLGRTQV